MVRQTTSADQDYDDLRWNDGRKRGFAPSPECNALSSVYAICSQDGHTPREGQTDLFEGNPADERKCTHRQPCDECIGTQNSDLVIRQCQASEDNGWSRDWRRPNFTCVSAVKKSSIFGAFVKYDDAIASLRRLPASCLR